MNQDGFGEFCYVSVMSELPFLVKQKSSFFLKRGPFCLMLSGPYINNLCLQEGNKHFS